MKIILLITLIAISSSSKATECSINGKHLIVGETIYVEDPALVKEAVDYLKAKKYSEKSIEEYLASADWVGYVLRCTTVYNVNKSRNKLHVGDVLIKSGAVLVPVEHQREWIDSIKNNSENLKLASL